MAIDELMAVVSPPKEPLGSGNEESWEQIQKTLGLRLPDDWYDFAVHYGTGRFTCYIYVLNPHSINFRKRFDELCESIRWQSEEGEVPFDTYPQCPGLLPWGRDLDGNQLFWLTDGEPENWPIIVRERGGERGEYDRFELPLTTFLSKVFTRTIETRIWPPPWFTDLEELGFEPEPAAEETQPELKSIHQLYEENGNSAGFWVRHLGWIGVVCYVKSVDGKVSGTLSGEPPEYERQAVIGDIFRNGELYEADFFLKTAYQVTYLPAEPVTE